MESNLNMKGLKELRGKLEDLQGKKKVTFAELFTSDFMHRYTQFQSLDEMFEKSGFSITSEEDFKKIPDAEWDVFISSHTNFKNWQEMQQKAGAEWISRQLK